MPFDTENILEPPTDFRVPRHDVTLQPLNGNNANRISRPNDPIKYQNYPVSADAADMQNECVQQLTQHSVGQMRFLSELDTRIVLICETVESSSHLSEITDSGLQRTFQAQIVQAFEHQALESGMNHKADDILLEARSSEGDEFVCRGVTDLLTNDAYIEFAPELLECVARIEGLGLDMRTWRVDILERALKNGNAEMRDAAIQAAEFWGPRMRCVLEDHHETEPWLREYLNRVIQDLSD